MIKGMIEIETMVRKHIEIIVDLRTLLTSIINSKVKIVIIASTQATTIALRSCHNQTELGTEATNNIGRSLIVVIRTDNSSSSRNNYQLIRKALLYRKFRHFLIGTSCSSFLKR